jgi:hypothetical protein
MFKLKTTRLISIALPTLLFISCGTSSNKEKILGSWETNLHKNEDLPEAFETSSNDKVVLTFKKDLSVESRIMRNESAQSTHSATYEFSADQNQLIVYREGKKDRKNVASIIKLTDTELTLVDVSGSGDTLELKRKD